MAYGVKNIPVIDLKPSTALGVSIPFSTPSVFTSVYTTQEQIKYNIINYLLTGRRERVFRPGFGAGLREQLFEQITDGNMMTLEAQIKSGVESNFPNIVVATVNITAQPDINTITVNFSYTITNTGQTNQIFLNFANGQ